jgi:hypothetical protein
MFILLLHEKNRPELIYIHTQMYTAFKPTLYDYETSRQKEGIYTLYIRSYRAPRYPIYDILTF